MSGAPALFSDKEWAEGPPYMYYVIEIVENQNRAAYEKIKCELLKEAAFLGIDGIFSREVMEFDILVYAKGDNMLNRAIRNEIKIKHKVKGYISIKKYCNISKLKALLYYATIYIDDFCIHDI
jgi:hypothetical protein